MLEQVDGLRLEGPGWPDRLEEVLQGLTFSERQALQAAPLGNSSAGVAVLAEEMLTRERTRWLPELLNAGSLYPHLQPIVSLIDGSTYGHEALIRGRVDGIERTGGEICAASRAHGALFTLDQVGRTVALEQGMPKLADGQVLFVNFTPTAIYDPAVCLRTTWTIAKRLGLRTDRICFEVVETEQFPDLRFLQRILDEYRRHGAMVALDDLGAGHSSLSYLAELRPNIVKLDRGLVSGIDSDPARQRVVSAMIDYAHELEIRVVAEGIETESELATVRDLGADLGQGWYLGRPAADPVIVPRSLVLDAHAEPGQRASVQLRDRALAAASSGVVICDATRPGMPIIYVNPAFERLTGYSSAEIMGGDCRFVQDEETDPGAIAEMGRAIRAGEDCRTTVRNVRKDRSPYWCDVHLSPVHDRFGRLVQYVGVQNDVSERVAAERELREQRDRVSHLALHDALTGLPNRRSFSERASRVLGALERQQVAVLLFIDLDKFKDINDQYGHDVGDEVLRRAAAELETVIGRDELIARHAGDEFLALLTDTDLAQAQARSQRIADRLRTRVMQPAVGGPVTASVGWALSSAPERPGLEELVRRADAMMYQEKRIRRASLRVA
jgi:diguanylate cyclase (GGDEF)-like protein/PAS domain S-box-containing protein